MQILIHVVDITQEDPVSNYKKINEELKKHSERLGNLYQIIALNKIDSVDEEIRQEYLKIFKEFSSDVFLISAATKENIKPFLDFVMQKSMKYQNRNSKLILKKTLPHLIMTTVTMLYTK